MPGLFLKCTYYTGMGGEDTSWASDKNPMWFYGATRAVNPSDYTFIDEIYLCGGIMQPEDLDEYNPLGVINLDKVKVVAFSKLPNYVLAEYTTLALLGELKNQGG